MTKKNTKERIFDVSIDLFSQYGYDGVSIRQIAKEVGIKESSIYNHYQSKESILESILAFYINEMIKEEAPVMQSRDNLDMDFDQFYKEGSDRFISKLSEEKMMKITRIFLVESYHNEKIKNFVKDAIIGYAIKGWEEKSKYDCYEFCSLMQSYGVKNLICTDISKDGAMQGTNRELYKELSTKFSIDITASGGVSSLEDIMALKKLNLYGAIIGKAYYTGAIKLEDALEVVK